MPSEMYDSALERAYEEQNLEEARRLLEAGADPNDPLPLGRLVDRAVFDDRGDEWVKLFALFGGAFDRSDEDGLTPLHHAATRSDDPEVVRLLLGLGVQVSPRSPTGWTPLHFAAAYGHRLVSEALFEGGADPCATTDEGLTASALAARNHHDELARRLDGVSSDRPVRRSVE